MVDRQRVRVGRNVTYRPTDAEAATGGGSVGDAWPAKITGVAASGAVNLFVYETDGTAIALTGILRGQAKGTYDLTGLGDSAAV
jgi:hypothetical protein